MNRRKLSTAVLCAAALTLGVADASATLPDPDGLPADMSKPVQVYLMMGQSNILGAHGRVNGTGSQAGYLDNAVDNKGLYPYLKDGNGNWTQRNDVRYVRVQGSGGPSGGSGYGSIKNNHWLNVGLDDGNIGVEYGVGHHLGNAIDAPVMVLTSAIGNRELGWDLLPPGSPRFEYNDNGTDYIYAGYGDRNERWEASIGDNPPDPAHNWRAGLQYDGDVARAKAVLNNIGTFYPGATEYEVAGFVWWQGDRDRYDNGNSARYEENLVRLIGALRTEFSAPDASFVMATLGQTVDGSPSGSFGANEQLMIDAMNNVDGDSGLYPDFAGNVATVYSNPLLGPLGGASNGHYNHDAETYMNVGEALGAEMVALIPEPTSLALLGIGGLLLARRRR